VLEICPQIEIMSMHLHVLYTQQLMFTNMLLTAPWETLN